MLEPSYVAIKGLNDHRRCEEPLRIGSREIAWPVQDFSQTAGVSKLGNNNSILSPATSISSSIHRKGIGRVAKIGRGYMYVRQFGGMYYISATYGNDRRRHSLVLRSYGTMVVY